MKGFLVSAFLFLLCVSSNAPAQTNTSDAAASLSAQLFQLSNDMQERKNTNDDAEGSDFARTSPATCALPHKSAFFVAACRKELGRLLSSKMSSDWAVASAQDSLVQAASTLKAWDAAWSTWLPKWEAENVPPSENDKYFKSTYGPRAYSFYNNARLGEATLIANRIVAEREGVSASVADSSMMISRCFSQLDVARENKDNSFAIDLALQYAKDCTSRLYAELRAAARH